MVHNQSVKGKRNKMRLRNQHNTPLKKEGDLKKSRWVEPVQDQLKLALLHAPRFFSIRHKMTTVQ